MDEYISKKAAATIPVLPKEHRKYQTCNLDDAYEQGWFDLQKCIEDLPSVQPEQQWTSNDKKPPEEEYYLVWMPWAPPKHMAVVEYRGGYWNIKTPVAAWMPLPEPYKEDEG